MTTPSIPGIDPITDDQAPPRRKRRVNWRHVGLAALLVLPNMALLFVFTYWADPVF